MLICLKKILDLYDIYCFPYIDSKNPLHFYIALSILGNMIWQATWKVEIPVIAPLDHGVYLASISKCSFCLIDPVEGIFYVTQRFVGMRLILCYMHKIYYCSYTLEYCKIIFD